MPSVSIFGVGRMGGALAIALTEAGYRIDNLIHRGSGSIKQISDYVAPNTVVTSSAELPRLNSDVILITTEDPEIANASATLARSLDNRPVVLHTSGSLSSDVLANLAEIGCPTGSMHPLVSISDALTGAASFPGVFFCVEGADEAERTAREMVVALAGTPFTIESNKKPLYHAAAVTGAGHVTALFDTAIEMLTKCGVRSQTAQQILLPLLRSTVANLDAQTPHQALTGTFARADVSAFDRHLTAMEGTVSKEVREIYLLLGERSVELAVKNGADPGEVQKLRDSISMAKRKSEC